MNALTQTVPTTMVNTLEPTDRYATDDDRYRAVETRDKAADGRFILAVKTTGVYCRPICPSRTPEASQRAVLPAPGGGARRRLPGLPALRSGRLGAA